MQWTRDYLEEGSIHGVLFLLRSISLFGKAVWVINIVVAFGLMAKECHKVAQEFISVPVSVSVDEQELDRAPPILVCPSVWINETKLSAIGDPKEVYKFWVSHQTIFGQEEGTLIHPALRHHDVGILTPDFIAFLAENVKTKPKLIEALNAKYASVADFLMDVARDPSFVFLRANQSFSLPEVTTTGHFACYLIEFEYEFTKFITPFPYHDILVRDVPPLFGMAKFSHRIYFGMRRINTPFDGIEMLPGTDYNVYATATTFARVDTPTRPCKAWDLDAWINCGSACINEVLCTSCKLVDVYTPTNFSKLCTVHNLFMSLDHCLIDYAFATPKGYDAVEKCAAMCPRPCVTRSFTQSIETTTGISQPNEKATGIRIMIHKALWSQYFEESYAYTWPTLVSRVGGVISLFFGASILSFVHVFVFCTKRVSRCN